MHNTHTQKKMKIIPLYLLILAGTLHTAALRAQDITDMEPEDYTLLKIPPLDVLFENSKKSAAVEYYEVKMEEEASALKTEKRSWLKYFKLSTSYQYGMMGINSSFSDMDTPLFYQYSGANQSWYNAGVSLNIPLDDLLDRGNRIKRQKLKTKATQVEIEKWHDEQKLRIIEMYTTAVKELSVLKLKVEALSFSSAQYKIAEQNFLNGHIEADVLSRVKKMQTDALESYEDTRAELNKALMQLEVLSKTRIINK